MRSFVLMILMAAASPAAAYTNLGMAKFIASSVPEGAVYVDRDRRHEMGDAVLRYWNDVNSRLPRLSPEERDWLTSELTATDPARRDRAVTRAEFHLSQLALIVDRCRDVSGDLTQAFKGETPDPFEMFHWTKVAECYHTSAQSLERHLIGAGLDDTPDDTDGYPQDAAILGGILSVVVQSAMADQMGWSLIPD